MDLIKVLEYKIHYPTPLDFLKSFLVDILDIQILNKTETALKQERALDYNKKLKELTTVNDPISIAFRKEVDSFLIERMSIYLAKMTMHDYTLSLKKPSVLAVGSIYVALKICE